MTTTAIHRMVEAARRGEHATVVRRLRSGWVVMAETQVTRGYCLLLPDPVVGQLNDLTGAARAQFLADMAAVGDAVLALTGAERINYEILGNLEPALHAHVVPRFAGELPEVRTQPIWLHDWKAAARFDPRLHGALQAALAAALAAVAE